jgi:hypothetical protein
MGAEPAFLLTSKTRIVQMTWLAGTLYINVCNVGGGGVMLVAIDPGKAACGMWGTSEWKC